MRPTRALRCVARRRFGPLTNPRSFATPLNTAAIAGVVLLSRVRAAGPSVLSARSRRSAARRSSSSRARCSPATRFASRSAACLSSARRFSRVWPLVDQGIREFA